MGEFESGKWILSLLIYFVIFFLLVWSVFNLKAWSYQTDPNVAFSDPGFYDISSFTSYGGACRNPSDLNIGIIPYGDISCRALNVTNQTCNDIEGCTWLNDSFFWGDYCDGDVNRSYYGITTYQPCEATSLQSQGLCKVFRCSWTNTSELYAEQVSLMKPYTGFSMFYETAKFMFGFETDLGFKQFGWIFALFFTYIPILALFWSLYMALPFLH